MYMDHTRKKKFGILVTGCWRQESKAVEKRQKTTNPKSKENFADFRRHWIFFPRMIYTFRIICMCNVHIQKNISIFCELSKKVHQKERKLKIQPFCNCTYFQIFLSNLICKSICSLISFRDTVDLLLEVYFPSFELFVCWLVGYKVCWFFCWLAGWSVCFVLIS